MKFYSFFHETLLKFVKKIKGMFAIGRILKEGREMKSLSLQSVSEKAGIDFTHLSRIENGKRLPTPEQIAILADLYGLDPKMLLVQRESDKIVTGIENSDIAIEALKTAKDKVVHGEKYLEHFQDELLAPAFKLESRRYIGSKTKLTDWIEEIINKEIKKADSFCDIFAGTGTVANRFLDKYKSVIVNDFLFANNIIYKAFFGPGEWDAEKLGKILDRYNSLSAADLDENYFSENFGGKFYDHDSAKIIGFVRQDIEDSKCNLTDKEYCILLASLIYTIDRMANTVGHFDAYIKKPIKPQSFRMRLVDAQSHDNVTIYREDSNLLAKKIKCDIVYIDPPYNSRQYCRFYHLYETLVKWDKPKLYGVALKPEPENMSKYCTTKATDAFRDLVQSLDAKYLVVSYNNTYNSKSSSSENKITLEELLKILKGKGRTKVFEQNYRFFNAGKTELDDHKEFIFVTKVNG